MKNKIITQVQTLKYLGIIMDYKLTFRDHINYVTEKCTRLVFGLAKSANINGGLGHKVLKTICGRNFARPFIRGTSMDQGNGKRKI